MSSDFAISWQKHTSGNLKQTEMRMRPHFISYVRTVPCKIWQQFLRHTVGLRHQIRSFHIKVKLSHQISIN